MIIGCARPVLSPRPWTRADGNQAALVGCT